MGVLAACMYICLYHMRAWCPWRPEEVVASSGPGITDGCEHHVGARELNRPPSSLSYCFNL